ncbi:MAG: 4-hydroxybenzoate solanesyltransferase [Pseudanabaenaceae cyanobacterium bins.68]|nr:4-hydroxybenzoate solanesyltransferase [Pseudanabaenaceae cyanobacterium bins.68]
MTSVIETETTFAKIVRLLRWDKPAGRLILMLPALWSLVLAARLQQIPPPPDLLGIVVLGSLATSAAGCVINDLWDRDLDIQVERTKARPLASRSLSIGLGVVVLIVAALCAFLAAAYLNPLSFGLSLAAVPVIAIYPACKRFFPIPQLVLSIAWGFSVLIPWAAVLASLNLDAWLLWGAVVAWTLGFDTIYALSDRPDDLRVGIKSSAIFLGEYTQIGIFSFFAIAVVLLTYLGLDLRLGYTYFVTVAIAALVWIWQFWRLNQTDLPSSTYQSLFRQNVWVGFGLLLGMCAQI